MQIHYPTVQYNSFMIFSTVKVFNCNVPTEKQFSKRHCELSYNFSLTVKLLLMGKSEESFRTFKVQTF
jgi:hypothetical protein